MISSDQKSYVKDSKEPERASKTDIDNLHRFKQNSNPGKQYREPNPSDMAKKSDIDKLFEM